MAQNELRALQQRLGITSLYVTHDQSEAMAISDKVVIMKDGVICEEGSPSDIFVNPQKEETKDFLARFIN